MDHNDPAETGDERGCIVSTTSHLPYGGREAETDAVVCGQVVDDWYGFTGKENEKEFGVLYFGARYYNPSLGSWCSVDPVLFFEKGTITQPASNTYGYVSNSPYNRIDPDGMDDVIIIGQFEDKPKSEEAMQKGSKAMAEQHGKSQRKKRAVHTIIMPSPKALKKMGMSYHEYLANELKRAAKAIKSKSKPGSNGRIERVVFIMHASPVGMELSGSQMAYLRNRELNWLERKVGAQVRAAAGGKPVKVFFVACALFGEKPKKPKKGNPKAQRRYSRYLRIAKEKVQALRKLFGKDAVLRQMVSYGRGRRSNRRKSSDGWIGYTMATKRGYIEDIYTTRRGKERTISYTLKQVLTNRKLTRKVSSGGFIKY